MNRVRINITFFLSLIIIALMTFFVTSTQAAPARPATRSTVAATSGGLFTGDFEGRLQGEDGSSAPATLVLVQTGRDVASKLTIGRGLIIDGGNCGLVEVPSSTQTVTGKTQAKTPRHLEAASSFKVQGIAVTIDLDGDLSRDGETLAAEAKIDLPWLCGNDPVITGEFSRAG